MWVAEQTRRELLSVLQGGSPAELRLHKVRPTELPSPGKGTYVTVWAARVQEARLPAVVICNPGEAKDIRAWSASYQSAISPISAYCRIMEPDIARLWFADRSSKVVSKAQNFCAAMIAAEAYCSLGGEQGLATLSPTGAARLLSFVLGRAEWLGYMLDYSEVVSDAWFDLRQLDSRFRGEAAERRILALWLLASTWTAAGAAKAPSMTLSADERWLYEMIAAYATHSELSPSLWDELTHDHPMVREALLADSTIEERVQALLTAIGSYTGKEPGFRGDIALGYLLSRIAPGRLDHLSLADRIRERSAAPILWYAFFAGLHADSQVVTAGSGRFLRIIREIFRSDDPLDFPRADISFAELRERGLSRERLTGILTNSLGLLAVELIPGVVAYLSLNSASVSPQPNLFDRDSREVPVDKVLRHLDDASKHFDAVRSLLQSGLKHGDDGGHRRSKGKKSRQRG